MVDFLPADRYVFLNGLNLHYLDWGDEGQQPLLLLHGHTGNAHIWDTFAAAMAPHFFVLALDQRGHGDSGWAQDGYTLEGYLADLEGFVAALGLERMVLVGLSMGGRNAYVYAARHPDKVERLIVVDIGPEPGRRARERMMADVAREPESFANEQEALAYLSSINAYPSPDYWRSQVQFSTTTRADGRLVWRWDPALRPSPSAQRLPVPDTWGFLERLSCPTLILRGATSDVLDPDVAQRMEKVIPQSTRGGGGGGGPYRER